MNQFKRAQVIMLPTVESQGDFSKERVYPCILKYSWMFDKDQKGKLTFVDCNIRTPTQLQHLYIISDDKIKEGDYFLADDRISKSSNNGNSNWVLCKCTKIKNSWIYCNEIPDEGHNEDWCKKIIATTDTSLKEKLTFGNKDINIVLPQPSQQFIEKYIEKYNNGEIITDVLVEYNKLCNKVHCSSTYKLSVQCTSPNNCQFDSLKINPKDNTITIKKLKDSWNKKEVIELIKKFNNQHSDLYSDTINNWIKQNL